MENKIIELWYKDDQFKNQFSSASKKEIIFNRWSVFKKIIRNHNFRKQKLNILDLGCGDGINVSGLISIFDELDYEYQITASDYNPSRVAKLQKKFPQVRTKMYDLLKDDDIVKYDLILFNHVLEHIENDKLALTNLNKLLSKEGLIILGIPNEGCFIAQLRNKIFQPKILKFTDHVNFYTSNSIEKKFEPHFRIKSLDREGFFMPHDLLQRWFRKTKIGRSLLRMLLFLFPSQSAGLIYGLEHK